MFINTHSQIPLASFMIFIASRDVFDGICCICCFQCKEYFSSCSCYDESIIDRVFNDFFSMKTIHVFIGCFHDQIQSILHRVNGFIICSCLILRLWPEKIYFNSKSTQTPMASTVTTPTPQLQTSLDLVVELPIVDELVGVKLSLEEGAEGVGLSFKKERTKDLIISQHIFF